MAGGVPQEHRTDSLSAAFNNLAEQEELTQRYQALCQHYGVRATRNNAGISHENGAIEARQGSLKKSLAQALLLRGSREFTDMAAYEQFVAETVRRLNARCARAWEAERACLKPLPARRTADFEEVDARVSKFGVFSAKSVLYSVPSRLAGHRLKVRLHSAHLEAWLGGVKVFECQRLHARGLSVFLCVRRLGELVLGCCFLSSGPCQAAGGTPRLGHVLMAQPLIERHWLAP
jgi:hypothetical protein